MKLKSIIFDIRKNIIIIDSYKNIQKKKFINHRFQI